MPPVVDMLGKQVGKLYVVSSADSKNGKAMWNCNCSCGNTTTVSGDSLRQGRTKSCGCLKVEIAGDASRTHGLTGKRPYRIYRNMLNRCYWEKSNNYHLYGAKGIGVCDSWRCGFDSWWADMKEGYEDSLTLGRIDSSKDYSKENCRWETTLQQSQNLSKMKSNTSGKTGVHWCDKVGLDGKSNLYAVASWQDINGKSRSKNFSVRKLGLLEAFAAAAVYRDAIIEELISQGAFYSEFHGK